MKENKHRYDILSPARKCQEQFFTASVRIMSGTMCGYAFQTGSILGGHGTGRVDEELKKEAEE